jgi:hypothetical protein
MSLRKNAQNVTQHIILPKLIRNYYRGKGCPKMGYSCNIKKTVTPKGKNSPYLVTLNSSVNELTSLKEVHSFICSFLVRRKRLES